MKKLHVGFLVLVLLAAGCKKDDPVMEVTMDGSIAEIENWANPAIIDSLLSLNFDINVGNTPPNIEGTYFLNPRILQNTNVPNDWAIGTQFFGLQFTISSQDNSKLIANFIGQEVDLNGNLSPGTIVVDNFIVNSFIAGSGNDFTCFFKILESSQGYSADLIYGVSGTKTANGITNIQNALFMLNDAATPPTVFIRTNTGRIFNDQDGLAENI